MKRTIPIRVVFDFSATPFFLRGSGYAEGTLFPWTVTDFSLMDAIESGIVKLPRVPVSDDVSRTAMPKLRNLWDHIGRRMPKRGPGKGRPPLDPRRLRALFETAFQALYSHYERTFQDWEKAGMAGHRSSSWSARTRRPRSWFTTTSPATNSRRPTARGR